MDESERSRKGEGRLFKRGKSWYWRVRVNGQEITRRLQAKNDEEVELERRRLSTIADSRTVEEVALFAGRAREIIKQKTAISLNESFEVFKKSSSRKPCGEDTLARHRRIWELFTGFVKKRRPGIVNVSELTIEDAEAWAQSIDTADDEKVRERDRLHARGFNGYLCTVRLISRILKRHGMESIFEHVRRKSGPVESKKDFTPPLLLLVFDSVDRSYPLSIPFRSEMQILFRIAAYTGLRLKCCCLLRWEDIDLKARIMKLTPYKTVNSSNIEVIIPIAPELLAWLPTPPASMTGYVLPNVAARYLANPSGVDQTCLWIIWYAVGPVTPEGQRPKKVKGYGFHSFRHTFVSFCLNAGVPIEIVQAIVGHKSVIVTRIYAHYRPEVLHRAVAGMLGEGAADSAGKRKEEEGRTGAGIAEYPISNTEYPMSKGSSREGAGMLGEGAGTAEYPISNTEYPMSKGSSRGTAGKSGKSLEEKIAAIAAMLKGKKRLTPAEKAILEAFESTD